MLRGAREQSGTLGVFSGHTQEICKGAKKVELQLKDNGGHLPPGGSSITAHNHKTRQGLIQDDADQPGHRRATRVARELPSSRDLKAALTLFPEKGKAIEYFIALGAIEADGGERQDNLSALDSHTNL